MLLSAENPVKNYEDCLVQSHLLTAYHVFIKFDILLILEFYM